MSPKKLFIASALIVAALTLPYACKTTKAPVVCPTPAATYTADVHPIIMANCLPCHGVGSNKGDFTTYEGLNAIVKNGDLVLHAVKKMDMPPSDVPAGNKPGPLSAEDRQKIQCWVNAGALNN